MRVFTFFIAITCSLHAAALDPGDAALGFMEKVRSNTLDLEPGADTALSPHTTETKRREISKRLKKMSKDLEGGILELGPVQQDGDYAGVIVRKAGGFDPTGLRVFSLALVKRDGHWLVAPSPASFDNAGLGYVKDLRERLEQLELWMLREQNVDLERLRSVAMERMRKEIGQKVSAEKLRTMSIQEIGEEFTAACALKDVAKVLGLMGGLSDDLPRDWSRRLTAVHSMEQRNFAKIRPWRLLSASEVVRIMVHHETGNKDGLFSIACLDPDRIKNFGLASVEMVHIEVSRDGNGLWRVDPPPSFYEEMPDDGGEEADGFDHDLIEVFPTELRRKYPAKPQATAAAAWSALQLALSGPDIHNVTACIVLGSEQKTSITAIGAAAQFWSNLNESSGARHLLPLAFREQEDEAVAICQLFSAREPDRSDMRMLRFIRQKDGWQWQASDTLEDVMDQTLNPEMATWVEEQVNEWSNKWQQVLLVDTIELKKIAADNPPGKEAAREVVMNFLSAVAANDIKKALGEVVWLADSRGAGRMLRNLGYEMMAAQRQTQSPEVAEVYEGKHWAAVGMKMDGDKISECPLYPVVKTEKGPKILLEVDLFVARKRGRDFLNGAAIERLAQYTDPAVLEEIHSFYQSFELQMKTENQPK